MKLDKSVQITLIIVLGIIIVAALAISTFKSLIPTNEDRVSVSGQSTLEVAPDLITLYFNVQTQGETSKEAEDENSKIVSKLRDFITTIGFSESDLKTQNFNIYPEYDWSKETRELIGYKATHSLKIELDEDNQDKLGDLIDLGVSAGAGISYINFELSDSLEQEYKAEAIKKAAEDAKIKAEAIAEGFDKRVGKLVSVSMSEFNYQPWRAYTLEANDEQAGSMPAVDSAAIKEAVEIAPSEQEVTAYVNAIYELR